MLQLTRRNTPPLLVQRVVQVAPYNEVQVF
jgi:hypothetical protein